MEGGVLGQGSSRVPGYKESQANNVLSHVSHGDLTTVAIVGRRVLLSISSDPSSNVFSADPFLHVYFSPASTTRPDVVETNSPTKVDRPIHQPGRGQTGSCYFTDVRALNTRAVDLDFQGMGTHPFLFFVCDGTVVSMGLIFPNLWTLMIEHLRLLAILTIKVCQLKFSVKIGNIIVGIIWFLLNYGFNRCVFYRIDVLMNGISQDRDSYTRNIFDCFEVFVRTRNTHSS